MNKSVEDGLSYLLSDEELNLNVEAKNPNNAYFRSKNTGKGFKGLFLKPEYAEYKERWKEEARKIMGENPPYDGNVFIVSIWTFGSKIRKDVQNCGKLEYDSFNGIVYQDDQQIVKELKYKTYEKKQPSVTFFIYKNNE